MNQHKTITGIDIVAANYNNTHFLPELVESIQCQTFTNWHLTIVDDHSTDNKKEILNELAKHPKISIILNEVNQGVCSTFHKGILNGTLPIVGLIGADDTLPSQAFEKIAESFTANPDAAMIYSNAIKCDVNMNPLGPWPYTSPISDDEHISNQLHNVFNFITFKRSAYERSPGLDAELKKAMDHDLTLKLYEQGQILHTPNYLYNYRCHDNGISQGESGVTAAQYSLLAQLKSFKRETRNPLNKRDILKKYHLYHTRSVFTNTSCESKPMIVHAFQSIKAIRTLRELRTTCAVILKSLKV